MTDNDKRIVTTQNLLFADAVLLKLNVTLSTKLVCLQTPINHNKQHNF